MTILELYVFAHLVLRSFTNGIDLIFGLQSSLALSITAIAVGFTVATYFFRRVAISRDIYKLITLLIVFILICLISYAVNSFAEDNIRDSFRGWYVIIQHLYLLSVIVLFASIYRSPMFNRYVYLACAIVIIVDTSVGVGQYLTGHTILVAPTDKYARVTGLSAHPVTFSLEIALVFLVCEISRRKQNRSCNLFHAAICLLTLVALILSASRTGILLLGIAFGLYYLIRRPILVPFFLAIAALIILVSPFETLFGELGSVPHYILSGDYTTWDYRTATTSFAWRIHHWYYLSSLALSHPWFGFGPGQVVSYSPFSLEAHSQFVEIFFEMGFVGLVSFGLFWFQMAKAALAVRPGETPLGSRHEADLRALWLTMFIGTTLVSLFDQSFNLETVSFTYLLVSIFVVQAPLRVAEKANRLSQSAKNAPAWRWRSGSLGVRSAAPSPLMKL